MKRIILIAAFVATIVSANAQGLNTSYFMPDAIVRSNLNPALTPRSGYVNIPAMGSIDVSFTSNALALDNLLYVKGNDLVWFLDDRVPADAFMSSLKDRNKFETSGTVNIFGFGFKTDKAFWSAGFDIKFNSAIDAPKSLFEFAKAGSGEGVYNFKNTRFDLNSYGQLYVGYARDITSRLSVGARAKFLVGIANSRIYYHDMTVHVSEQEWKIDVTGQFDISANGASLDKLEDDEYIDYRYINYRPKGPSGYGIGVDLGASYKLLDNLTLSAGLTDIGFISWGKRYTISGDSDMEYIFQGIDINDEQTNLERLDQVIAFDYIDPRSRTSSIATTLNVGGEYSILDNKIGFGLLSTTTFGSVTISELTASVNFRPVRWFSGSLSYSYIRGCFRTFGLALNFNPSWINFFVGTDYMAVRVTPQLMPIKSRAMNLNFGLAVPIGYKK